MQESGKVIAAVLLIVIFSAFSNFRHLYQVIQEIRPLGSDEVSQFEKKIAALKSRLPENAVVGYTTDKVEDSLKEYCFTAYSLCPVTPVPSLDYKLVIGNFSRPVAELPISRDRRFLLLQDFGNGIFLYQNTTR